MQFKDIDIAALPVYRTLHLAKLKLYSHQTTSLSIPILSSTATTTESTTTLETTNVRP